MIEDVSRAAKGRFTGDPANVYENLETGKEGEREEEAVVSMVQSMQLLVVHREKYRAASKKKQKVEVSACKSHGSIVLSIASIGAR